LRLFPALLAHEVLKQVWAVGARFVLARRRVVRDIHHAVKKAYPVDSGTATCCALNDRIRPVAGTTINGQRAFAFAISESVF
jgi:hypothetical protein